MSAPAVPLKVLVDTLAALEAVVALPTSPLISTALFMQLVHTRNRLDTYLVPILQEQLVRVSA